MTETTQEKPKKSAAAVKKPAADRGRRYRGVSEEARQAERRQRFVEAGLTVFGSRGYHSSTVRSICAEAGLTERYFYESFSNSEDLLCVVYDYANQRIREGILGALSGTPREPSAIAYATLVAFLTIMRDDPRMAQILFVEVLGVSERVDAKYRASVENFAQLMQGLISPLLDGDSLPTPLQADILSVAMLGSVITVVSRWMIMGFQEPIETIADNLHAVLVAMMRHLITLVAAPGSSDAQ
ncbi:MAG: TetR/AcrR family transcriptional regulator [Paraperlucidibaca sp.]